MLTKSDCGWTAFSLEGTSTYGLSYLDDISSNLNEWATFVDYVDRNVEGTEKKLLEKLDRLKTLISEKAECFDEGHCFL